ncbi:cobalamin-dependent protein [Inconstantimicrobium porci]|uniref:Cobalamin B12-binding domain-containing protein n=1 Tax=Inconstantimicrobium porci TaxID=2652291 RepID=A0A7X2N0W0_9CLOT|nr:cobalamin-dependent protein [Inconstantimicrobium porci]MSR92691.1 cobalamin B12-binding domain-containing protein [Inconstantimicrobium porci]
MNVVLVQPVYSLEYDITAGLQMPLGLLSIATVTEKCGHNVHIVDLQKEININKLRKISEDLIKKFSQKILSLRPHVIGVSCMSVSYIFITYLLKRIHLIFIIFLIKKAL